MTPQEILKKQYELKYKPQKYENSIVKTVQEDFVVKAMNEYAKQELTELLGTVIISRVYIENSSRVFKEIQDIIKHQIFKTIRK